MATLKLQAIWRHLATSRAARNVAASYLAFISNAAYGLISIPIAVRYLSAEEIGLWTIVSAFVNYLLWFDMGVGDAIGRKIADPISHGDQIEVSRWWTASLTVLSFQGLIMAAVAIAVSPFLGTCLQVDGRLAADARFLFLGAALVAAIGMPVRAYPGILMAQQRFHWVPITQTVMPWVQLLIFVALLRHGIGIRAYLPSVVGGWLAGWAVLVSQVHWGPDRFALDVSGLTRERFGSLFRYSGSIAIMGLVATIMQSLPSLIVARFGGLEQVPIYNFSSTGPGVFRSLTARTLQSFHPGLQHMYITRNQLPFIQRFRAVNMLAIGMAIATAGAVLTGNRALVEWLANKDYYVGPLANGLFAAALILSTLITSFNIVLYISGSMRQMVVFCGLQVAAATIGSWAGYRTLGIAGVIIAIALATFAFQGLYALLRGAQTCNVSAWELAGNLSLTGLAGCVAAIVLAWWLGGQPVDTDPILLVQRMTRPPTAKEWIAGLAMAIPGVLIMGRQLQRIKSL